MTRFLRLGAVKDLTGLSRSSIYADPTFPRPVKLLPGGRSVGWIQDEILSWIDARIHERDEA